MDAFYASIEQERSPSLRGQPVIVGGLGARGVVSAASYEARAFGVHSALPMHRARQLCPHGQFLRGQPVLYREVSSKIHSVFLEFSPLVEPLALDEAFLDVSKSQTLFGNGKRIAERLRARVREETALTVSVGVATSKFVAKVASGLNKPDHLTVVKPGDEGAFLAPLPISRLWGIGAKTQQRLAQLGLLTIGDLQALTITDTIHTLGEKAGPRYHRLCRGEDERPVQPQRAQRSRSLECTFERDLSSRQQCHQVLLEFSSKLGRSLRQSKTLGSVIRIKLRDPDFTTHTRQRRLRRPTHSDQLIYHIAKTLFDEARPTAKPLRLLGLNISGLIEEREPIQTSLFEPHPEQERSVLKTLDQIRDRFGENAIINGKVNG